MDKCPPGERLSGFLDGELAQPEADAVARHLGECASCGQELASLRKLREAAADLPAPAVSGAEWQAAWAAIERRIGQPRRRRATWWSALRRARLVAMPAAVAALVALTVGLWALHPRNGAPPQARVECVLEEMEVAPGYPCSSSYADDDGVTMITVVAPHAPREGPSSNES